MMSSTWDACFTEEDRPAPKWIQLRDYWELSELSMVLQVLNDPHSSFLRSLAWFWTGSGVVPLFIWDDKYRWICDTSFAKSLSHGVARRLVPCRWLCRSVPQSSEVQTPQLTRNSLFSS